MPTFDENSFLDQPITGESSTQFKLLPVEANPYTAIIKKDSVKFRQTQGKQDPTKTYFWLDMELDMQLPPQVAEELNRQTSNLRYSVGLDVTDSGLDMAEGRNVQLGRLRRAVDQNHADRPWNPRMLEGS